MKENTQLSSRLQHWFANGAIATLAVTSVVTLAFIPPAKASFENSPKVVVDEVWQIVNNEFVGSDFDREQWQVTRQELLERDYASQDEAYLAIREALRDLGDPYTRFLNPKEFEELTTQTTGELSGIGVRLQMDDAGSALTIVESLNNSPAKEAGIQEGDRILRINNQPTALMKVEQAAELLRGEEGSSVTLQLTRPNKGLFEVTLTRAPVEVPVLHYSLQEENGMKVGYMYLEEFSSHAAEQMQRAIAKLQEQGVNGFVLDLRGNPGGLLFASVDIARMWMETGKIVKTIDRMGGDREYSADRTSLTELPLVVLVDGYSASASEILAGALKDNGRATLVGTQTYGKGTVQSVHSLSDSSGLAVTMSRYYPPSGININKHGIAPDVEVSLNREQQRLLRSNPTVRGSQRDPHYSSAVGVLRERFAQQSVPATPPAPISIRQLIEQVPE
ncbi:carboxyl-terminal processing protease CtpB [Spirulina sp. 06S082]|uniref:carboxyl-terminal processing protease CtpB n=1 Tax=Spirulina sp. 06S082 TaxID=3110248 RepID=UPI002B2091D9|nr:carboxyl-terminal processing protease CtpB [Spirulina sp. 06S082]MEA5469567.1 S41 family peptidase [Spirulina sp. 06S082]